MSGKKITDIQIRHWLRAGLPVNKAQGEVPGLCFTLSAKGTATWVLRYRLGEKQKELTLGRYPDFGIPAAKAAALEARSKVQSGIDVCREKRQAKRIRAADKSFKALALDYAGKVLPTMASSTRTTRDYHIHDWLIPKLGAIPAREVNGADIVEVVEAVGRRSHSQAALLFVTASGIFQHGIARSILSANPCRGLTVRAILGKAPPQKDRIKLTEAEIRALLPALPSVNDRFAATLKILLITAVRVSELMKAEWRHIDFEKAEWTIPNENVKTGKGYVIPLPPLAMALFHQLEVMACGSPYVLPGTAGTPMTTNSVRTGLARLRRQLPSVRRFTPHDLRSTARSHWAGLGIPLIVAERALNHSLGGIVAVYDQHDYLDERRRALTLWADFLTACETGREWQPAHNVVQLRASA